MSSFISPIAKPFSRELLDDLLALVSGNARARWPQVTYLLNSDVAWRLPGSAPEQNIRLWYDDLGVAAYAWFESNGPVAFDIRIDLGFDSSVCTELVYWLEERRRQFPPMFPWLLSLTSMQDWQDALSNDLPAKSDTTRLLQVSALDGDKERCEFLQASGFEPTQHFAFSLTRSLDDLIPEAPLPAGYTIRPVEEADFEQRVDTHRDAWFKSTFTLEQYQSIRATPIFESSLDLVAESPTGEFGSYCIGWIDRELGIGSFEPVGTRPSHRRLGLGQSVNCEGLRRMKTMNMHSAKIGTAGFNDRAFGLYTSCGFKVIDKDRTWVKALKDV